MDIQKIQDPKAEILIVDDTLPNLRLLSTMLISHGYEVREAPDGLTALSLVNTQPPDLILLDIRMPGMDGYEVCQRLKENQRTRHIPVIFVSALDEQTDKVQGFAVGGVDYITKPLQVKEVIARVETHLALRDLQSQLERQNTQLQLEIQERQRAEAALQRANEELEQRVQERTAELIQANQSLESELQERRRAEQALLESQRLNQSIMTATPGIVYIFDLWQLKIIYTNQNIGSLLGYSDEEIAEFGDDYFLDLLHPEDSPRVLERFKQWDTVQYEDVLTIEYRMQTRDGEWRWYQGRDTLFKQSEDGRAQQIIGTSHDITDRKRAEAERERLLIQVREQAQQVREIMNTVPEGVILLDPDGKILLANPAALRDLRALAGLQVGDTLSHLGDCPLPELLTSPPEGLWHEVKIASHIFEVVARPMTGGEYQHWVLVMRDATQEREIQQSIQQQERLAAVGQLAAGIAHDFNNILAVILLYTEMMLGSPDLPVQLSSRLLTISQQAKRASDLIQQILDFSRRAVLERRPMDLLPFLKEQVKLLERTLPENIQIDLNYHSGEYMVEADPTRLQQAIMNLAVNARDAMPDGGRLHIELTHLIEGAPERCTTCGHIFEECDWLRITVGDTGSGILPDVLPHIFDPFFTTKAPGQGTGLGLAQVYGLIKQHEGHVDVYTQVGQGSTFNLYLPALPQTQSPPLDQDSFPFMRGKGQTLLLVEDEAATRQALVDGLTLLGYNVLSATNGREALNILEQRSEEIDLVLSDVVMPEMGGIALLHSLHQQGYSAPVVLMTGHPMQEELEELQAEGLAAWLLKPPRLKHLAEVIAKQIDVHDE